MGSICKTPNFPQKKSLKDSLVKCIEDDNLEELMEIIQNCVLKGPREAERLRLDEPIMFKHTIPMNALSYALALGRLKSFRYLYEEAGASLAIMHEQISYLRKKPVDLLIDDCNFEFLDYYLPIHLDYHRKNPTVQSTTVVDDLSFISRKIKVPLRPKNIVVLPPSIQRAVEKGNLKALKYLLRYFERSEVPSEFDVHYLEDASGENCGLVAVRSGNLEMVKFLHQECRVDFTIHNKRRESALQVAAAVSKKKPKLEFFQIIKYLVEEAHVDIAYNCEETLMLCEDSKIISYLESKLEALGVSTKKFELDAALPTNMTIRKINSEQMALMRHYEETSVSELLKEEHKRRNSLSTIKRESQESVLSADLPF